MYCKFIHSIRLVFGVFLLLSASSINAAIINILDVNAKGGVVSETLDAGHYQLTPTDTLGIYVAWNNLNDGTPGWWRWSYGLIIPEINSGNLFTVGVNDIHDTARIAYDTRAVAYDFELTSTQTIQLLNTDPYKPDNIGGVSVILQSITSPTTVPEPSMLVLFVSGMLMMLLTTVKNKKKVMRNQLA